jgi:replicative DNA helicase
MSTAFADPDLEKLLLGLIFHNNRAADHIGQLRVEDLTGHEAQTVLEAMLALRNESRAINAVTLGAEFAGDPLGGPSLIQRLASAELGSSPPDIRDVAHRLVDMAARRQIVALSEQMASRAGDPKTKTPDLISGFFKEFDGLLARSSTRETLRSIAAAVDDATERWQQPDDCRTIPTGISDFDAALGGLDPESLIILAGRPSMGKTACAIDWALQAAKRGYGALIFSMEMREEHCVARMASSVCGIPYKKAIRKELNAADLDKFIRAAMGISHLSLVIDDAGGQTVAQISAKVRRTGNDFERKGKRLSLVVVDHLTKLTFNTRYAGNRHLEIGEATTALAALAKSQNVAVLALSQLNRKVEERENKRPMLSDMRESGSIEEDADVVIFPFREAYYLERQKCSDPEEDKLRLERLAELSNVLELQIAKCRNGETATVKVFADMATNRLGNLDWRHS